MIDTHAVRIIGTKKGKKGAVKFVIPIFELYEASEETNNVAIELDKELQEYLSGYLSRRKGNVGDDEPHWEPDPDHEEESDISDEEENSLIPDDETNDLPF